MRCNTPNMRSVSREIIEPEEKSTNGNQFNKNPIRKISANRLSVFVQNFRESLVSVRFTVKANALPTANRKDGNTRSVAVNPCHDACNRNGYTSSHEPGEFTIIMKQTVMPRNTSSDIKRGALMIIWDLIYADLYHELFSFLCF